MSTWAHHPGPMDAEGRTYCLRCGRRIYQNTGSLIRERHPGEWGHPAPGGSSMGFLFTCSGEPQDPIGGFRLRIELCSPDGTPLWYQWINHLVSDGQHVTIEIGRQNWEKIA